MTTLEWLLIVAAVAGLAALAVVLVTSVVSDTSERISDSSPRHVAASLAAAEIVDESKAPDGIDPDWSTWATWVSHFTQKCRGLEVLYGDAGVSVTADFRGPTTLTGPGEVREFPDASLLRLTETEMAKSHRPYAKCEVG